MVTKTEGVDGFATRRDYLDRYEVKDVQRGFRLAGSAVCGGCSQEFVICLCPDRPEGRFEWWRDQVSSIVFRDCPKVTRTGMPKGSPHQARMTLLESGQVAT